MENKTFLILLSLIILIGCTNNNSQQDYISDIETIENGLLPVILTEGEDTQTLNIHERMRYYNVPGVSIAFMDHGDIIWAKGYGYTSFDSTTAVDPYTLFQAASISKPVAAMAALHLVEEGKLGLDDNVNDHLTGWQVEENRFTRDEKVTLRRILSHSSGLTVHGFAGYSNNDTVPGIIDVLNGKGTANSGRIYPDTIPGSIYRYSGGGYTVMQKMLCDITKKDFPDLMNEYVLAPIGMESSTYIQPLPIELESNAALAYRVDGTVVEGKWHTYPEMAAAGLWTNPTDLLKYAIEVQKSLYGKSNKVISKEMAREMLKPQINSHGLGPGVEGKNRSATFGHGGANEGYRCQLYVFSHNGQGVAIMTNSDNGDRLTGEILRAFSSIYNWDNYKPIRKKIVEIELEKLNELEGDYILERPNDELIVNFSVKDNHLEGLQIWDNFKFEIYPESEELFFNKEDRASFKFVKNNKGEITRVIIQDQWHFVRKNELE